MSIRDDNAGVRTEGRRVAMRARIAGADPRHHKLDQGYYQRWPERARIAYPMAAHEALERAGESEETTVYP